MFEFFHISKGMIICHNLSDKFELLSYNLLQN